jgi:hypothetical protein
MQPEPWPVAVLGQRPDYVLHISLVSTNPQHLVYSFATSIPLSEDIHVNVDVSLQAHSTAEPIPESHVHGQLNSATRSRRATTC